MKKILIILISVVIIVILCCVTFELKKDEEQQESETISYDIDEKLVSVDIGYSGNTEWDIIVINFEDETLRYTTYEDDLDVKVYELINANKIYEYFKEHILYGNWNGRTLKPTHYMSDISPQDMGKQTLWSISVSTSEEENKYEFSGYDSLPMFWNELVNFICEGTEIKSEVFGIMLEEIPEEVTQNNNSTDITNIKIQYEGVPNISKGVINIEFNTKEMLFESSDNIVTKYELDDSNKIIKFLENKVLCDDWDKDMIEPPDEVLISRPAEYYPYKLLWTITIKKSNEEYIYGDYDKYPYFWYDLIDLICEETGVTRRTLDIY